MNSLNTDIWQIIFNMLDFVDQIHLRQVCRYFSINCHITHMKIRRTHKKLISKLKYFPQLHTLHIGDDVPIKNKHLANLFNLTDLSVLRAHNTIKINHLTKLRTLRASDQSRIIDSSIRKLTTLTTLNISNNPNIMNINHMKQLETLIISDDCGVYDSGISKLTDLVYL